MRATGGWSVYMVRCRLGRLYTGISTDVARRLEQHRDGRRGARSLRGKGPLELVWSAPAGDRGNASRAEWHIKRLPRRDKERLAAGDLSLDDIQGNAPAGD